MYKKNVLVLILIALIALIFIFVMHPLAITQGGWQGPGLIGVLVITLGIYLIIALHTRDTNVTPTVVACGYLIGACWIVEILLGNLNLHLPALLLNLFYRGPILFVAVVNIGISSFVVFKQKSFPSGVMAGLRSGMISGLMAIITLASLIIFTLPIQLADPQNKSQFLQSHTVNFAAFVVQDYIFAGISHLWIGLLGGLIFGSLGATLAVTLRKLKLLL